MDKISILEIKEKRLTSPEAVANVRRELALLLGEAGDVGSRADLLALRHELRAVNEALWEIEDRIRAKEAAGTFDSEFVELARAVYFHNNRRGVVKRRINQATNSDIIEEKQYTAYRRDKA